VDVAGAAVALLGKRAVGLYHVTNAGCCCVARVGGGGVRAVRGAGEGDADYE